MRQTLICVQNQKLHSRIVLVMSLFHTEVEGKEKVPMIESSLFPFTNFQRQCID